MMRRALVALLVATACTGAEYTPIVPDAAVPADAEVVAAPSHVLITEVYSQTAAGEFIEIHNPTDAAVDLSTYFVSDSGEYPRLPSAGVEIDARDFVFQFPAGATLEPGAVAVVARHEADFEAGFGVAADYAMTGIVDAQPMRDTGSGIAYEMSDIGEVIALFHWDGASDLVADVDLVITGIPQPNNDLPDKTGQSVDGPDADGAATTYADETRAMPRFDAVTTNVESYKRIALGELGELGAGGNGVGGHDESSEDTARSWGRAATFSAPTPGTLDAAPRRRAR